MANPSSRQELIDYCLRELGEPVLEVNVDPDQISDRIDEALQFYQEYHSDATKKVYYAHEITQTDVTNKYITISDQILFVERIFPLLDPNSSTSMFDVKYQLHLNDVYQLGNLANLAYYDQVQQNLALYDMKLGSGMSEMIRFARHENRIYLDTDDSELQVGNYIIVSATSIVDPNTFTAVYNDMYLKKYATQLIKRQWGANLIKFEGMQLPGGVTLNGRQLFDDAKEEIDRIEEAMRLTHEMPVNFFMG
jgi:hypothetical protein